MPRLAITSEDRRIMERMYLNKARVADIAVALGIHLATAYRELHRGYTGREDANGRPAYSAALGDQVMKQHCARKGMRCKRRLSI